MLVDQLQKTVASQQQFINKLNGNNNRNGYNMYPVLQSNVNQNDNGRTNGCENDAFEYVSCPGCFKKVKGKIGKAVCKGKEQLEHHRVLCFD